MVVQIQLKTVFFMRMVSQTRWVGHSLFRPNKCMHHPKGCSIRGNDSQAEYRLWLFGLLNKLSFWIRSLKRIVNWVDALYIFLLLVICSIRSLKRIVNWVDALYIFLLLVICSKSNLKISLSQACIHVIDIPQFIKILILRVAKGFSLK